MRYSICLFVLLAGCASPEAIRAQQEQEAAAQQARQEAYRQQVFGQCRAYGFRDGTPEFRNCLMQVDQANQQQNAQMRAVILQQEMQQQYQQMPLCSSLSYSIAALSASQGTCRR